METKQITTAVLTLIVGILLMLSKVIVDKWSADYKPNKEKIKNVWVTNAGIFFYYLFPLVWMSWVYFSNKTVDRFFVANMCLGTFWLLRNYIREQIKEIKEKYDEELSGMQSRFPNVVIPK